MIRDAHSVIKKVCERHSEKENNFTILLTTRLKLIDLCFTFALLRPSAELSEESIGYGKKLRLKLYQSVKMFIWLPGNSLLKQQKNVIKREQREGKFNHLHMTAIFSALSFIIFCCWDIWVTFSSCNVFFYFTAEALWKVPESTDKFESCCTVNSESCSSIYCFFLHKKGSLWGQEHFL